MGYPIILCEDNLVQLQQLENIIRNYILFHSELLKIVLKTQCPQEVKDYLIEFQPQNGIYFLDIDLNHSIDGIQLAEIIRKHDAQAKIIFITTHDELAPLTLKRRVEPLGFVSKDLEFDLFRSKIMDMLSLGQERIDSVKSARKAIFTFSVGTQTYNIDMDEVQFIEPSIIPHRVVLYTKHGQYEFYSRLNELEEKYPLLFRASRSCLANLMNATEINFSKRLIVFKKDLSRKFSVGRSKILRNLSITGSQSESIFSYNL
ncbi:response regulator transcription factor [Enterococcus villorum]|uniref:response regulator transcription factor n=1 Tax=Enterococcus villorum TaxID=112904 RepID=UPI003F8ADCBE